MFSSFVGDRGGESVRFTDRRQSQQLRCHEGRSVLYAGKRVNGTSKFQCLIYLTSLERWKIWSTYASSPIYYSEYKINTFTSSCSGFKPVFAMNLFTLINLITFLCINAQCSVPTYFSIMENLNQLRSGIPLIHVLFYFITNSHHFSTKSWSN